MSDEFEPTTTAKGLIECVGGVRLTGTFTPEGGVPVKLSGTIAPGNPTWKASAAQVVYTDPLGGSQNFEGTVTKTHVKLTLNDKVVIDGDLDEPIPEAFSVSGNITWVPSV
jgi:hypothetical protein